MSVLRVGVSARMSEKQREALGAAVAAINLGQHPESEIGGQYTIETPLQNAEETLERARECGARIIEVPYGLDRSILIDLLRDVRIAIIWAITGPKGSFSRYDQVCSVEIMTRPLTKTIL